jgi:hypothetical protein
VNTLHAVIADGLSDEDNESHLCPIVKQQYEIQDILDMQKHKPSRARCVG